MTAIDLKALAQQSAAQLTDMVAELQETAPAQIPGPAGAPITAAGAGRFSAPYSAAGKPGGNFSEVFVAAGKVLIRN